MKYIDEDQVEILKLKNKISEILNFTSQVEQQNGNEKKSVGELEYISVELCKLKKRKKKDF